MGEEEKKKAEEEGKEEDKKEEKKDEETVEEKEEEPEEMSEDEVEEKEEEEKNEDPPKVELSEEEKKQWFIKSTTPDLPAFLLSRDFAKFSAPEKAEGFDDIKYSWADAAKSKQYMKNWIVEKKNTTKVEDLKPGEWFNKMWQDKVAAEKTWYNKLNQYKKDCAQKEANKRKKEAAAAAAAAKAKKEAEKEKKDEEEGKKEESAEKKEEATPMEVEEEKEEEEVEVDFAGLDVFEVEDVMDLG